MLTLQVKEKEIENLTPEEEFIRGTVGAKCQINFDEFWQGYEKYIVFKRVGYEPINIMVDRLENEIEIPYTILTEIGEFKIGVFGITETETLPTLYSKDIKILYGTDTHGTTPPTYIPSEIDQLRLSKQDKLVSGENIKTVNGESVLGSGNIEIQVEVDQTYDPDSTNAQSGKAVSEALSGYVVAEVGKGLSSNDFTNEDKEKLYSALQNENIDKTYNPTSENAQSGIAVKEAIDNTIDQTYSPTSTNAQSGKAVAEAVKNKVDKLNLSKVETLDNFINATKGLYISNSWDEGEARLAKLSYNEDPNTIPYRGGDGQLRVRATCINYNDGDSQLYEGNAVPHTYIDYIKNAIHSEIMTKEGIVSDRISAVEYDNTSIKTVIDNKKVSSDYNNRQLDWNSMYLLVSNTGKFDIEIHDSVSKSVVKDGDGNALPKSRVCILILPKENTKLDTSGTRGKLCLFIGLTGTFSITNFNAIKALQFSITNGANVYLPDSCQVSTFKIGL